MLRRNEYFCTHSFTQCKKKEITVHHRLTQNTIRVKKKELFTFFPMYVAKAKDSENKNNEVVFYYLTDILSILHLQF